MPPGNRMGESGRGDGGVGLQHVIGDIGFLRGGDVGYRGGFIDERAVR